MNNTTIAVVDDDSVFRYTAKIHIHKAGENNRILMFEDGKEAIEYVQENKSEADKLPDIILLDLNMPFMDGWDFLQAYLPVRNDLAKEITIYIVSSSVDEQDITRARSISYVKDYLVKPIKADQIMTMLDQVTVQ